MDCTRRLVSASRKYVPQSKIWNFRSKIGRRRCKFTAGLLSKMIGRFQIDLKLDIKLCFSGSFMLNIRRQVLYYLKFDVRN